MLWVEIGISLVKIALVLFVVLTLVAYLTLAERRISAFIQDRLGPNRVGPFGFLQPLADGVKFIFKEDIIPGHAYKPFYVMAPALSLVTAIIALAVIPIGKGFNTTILGLLDQPFYVKLQIADINAGLLYVLAITSLSVYGVVLGGWSSNSKYSLLGGLRAAAQMISYELSLGLSILGVILLAGSLRLSDIVEAQERVWFAIPQALGFLVFMVSSFAETNRLPFDLPEAEPEIVAGYHTEYSSMKFAMFFMGEYIAVMAMSGLFVTMFLGGWTIPGMDLTDGSLQSFGLSFASFMIKMMAVITLTMWIRWTLPRFKYTRLMELSWKGMIPIAFVWLALSAVLYR